MSSSVARRKELIARWSKRIVDPITLLLPAQTHKRKYTNGLIKPPWAVHGCRGSCHKNKIICQPQFPEEQRPKKNKWHAKFVSSDTGFSCIHPECVDYSKKFKTKQGAQQHARKHYPAEYSCSCAGEWYLKTEFNQHFLKPCPTCDKLFMKGSLPGHIERYHKIMP